MNRTIAFLTVRTRSAFRGPGVFQSLLGALLWCGVTLLNAAPSDGFRTLFNGHDLTGWVNVNCAPETWTVRDGVIHCTGLPTGALRTTRQYENFILEIEWRHLSAGGNSGVFIWGSPVAAPGVPFLRGIEVQVLDHGYNAPGKNDWYTTQGDVFPIHGASMKPFGRHNGMRSFPSSEHSKGSPQWNHYLIAGTNGVLRLSVNGTEVSGGSDCNYRKGYLALESEGAPVEFRNLRIRELAPGNAGSEVSAPIDEGWHSLFTGLDLRGWRTNAATASHWSVKGERLHWSANPPDSPSAAGSALWTSKSFRDAEWMFDCRPTGKVGAPLVWISGAKGAGTGVRLPPPAPDRHERYAVRVLGRAVTVARGGVVVESWTLPDETDSRGEFGLGSTGEGLEFMNLYVRDVR